MDNYPIGTKDNPDAPWNEPLDKTYKRFVSVTISYYDTISLPEGATEEQIKEELFSRVYNGNLPKKYDIDEFVMLE